MVRFFDANFWVLTIIEPLRFIAVNILSLLCHIFYFTKIRQSVGYSHLFHEHAPELEKKTYLWNIHTFNYM